MADVPALSELTERKLALQWDTVLDKQKLTEKDLSGYDRQRQHFLGIAARPPRGVNPLRPKEAARSLGLDPSVKAAERRFRSFDWEYWVHWCASGAGYEVYRGWLDILKQQILDELASIWKGKSDATDRWFQGTCAPAIEKALAVLVKQRIAQARDAESKRLERAPTSGPTRTGNPILDEIYAGGEDPEAIRRLIESGGDSLSPQAQKAVRLARAQMGRPAGVGFSKADNVGEKGRARPGPRTATETAQRVLEIVTQTAGSEPWKSKLDDICDALDDKNIPRPKTWSKRDPPIRSWTDAATTDSELAKKAIEYRLKIARR